MLAGALCLAVSPVSTDACDYLPSTDPVLVYEAGREAAGDETPVTSWYTPAEADVARALSAIAAEDKELYFGSYVDWLGQSHVIVVNRQQDRAPALASLAEIPSFDDARIGVQVACRELSAVLPALSQVQEEAKTDGYLAELEPEISGILVQGRLPREMACDLEAKYVDVGLRVLGVGEQNEPIWYECLEASLSTTSTTQPATTSTTNPTDATLGGNDVSIGANDGGSNVVRTVPWRWLVLVGGGVGLLVGSVLLRRKA